MWVRAVNRQDPKKKHLLLQPSKDHRVCSDHFIDSCPTAENPYPMLKLGYKPKEVIKRRIIERCYSTPYAGTFVVSDDTEAAYNSNNNNNSTTTESPDAEKKMYNNLAEFCFYLITFLCHIIHVYTIINFVNKTLHQENQQLKEKIKELNIKIKLLNEGRSPYVSLFEQKSEKIQDDNVTFFTGLLNMQAFTDIHAFVAPFVRTRWRGLKLHEHVRVKRLFTKSPQKMGPERKLRSEDEFLLTMMRLRLNLLNRDLATRFNISITLCQQIFHGWLTAMSKTIGNLVHWPSKEEVLATKPLRYKHLPDLPVIIDCSEIFIETPKDNDLQTRTWSDYKHHNTLKFLVGVAPNSAITFISSCYGGRLSDKRITIDSGFLDLLDEYDMVQADKGFHIQEECLARFITLHVPPGKRGLAQMSVAAVNKTKRIANLRILVEQVIRRLKTFRIIGGEVQISLVPHIDKIVKVCAGLCNLREPIYSD